MPDSYDAPSRRAKLKAKRKAKREFFELGEILEHEENFKEAASVYCDAVIAYRLAVSREWTWEEETEAYSKWKSEVEEIYRRWLESNPNGACKLPRRVSSVEIDSLFEIVAS